MMSARSKLLFRLAFPAALAVVLGLGGCARHKHDDLDLEDSAEPDKILYERSVEDIQNKRFDVARLTLQTLLNTYPDSDYLAQAKLAIADSYFQEGSRGALTHAEVEYKDFITFFPNAPEVAFAQYRAAMTNFRRLEKPDRDRTYAKRAEREFQLLLKNYGDSEFADDGEKKLIQVQEVLAEGEYRIARFYFNRNAWRAAASRLVDLVERYPNYSLRDQGLWMLGYSFEQEIPNFWRPDQERAAAAYSQIVQQHPTSQYGDRAREALARLGQPIPEPDPVLLARAQNLEPLAAYTEEDQPGLLGRLFGMFGGRPDVSSAAARLGPPPLDPPREKATVPPPPFAVKPSGSSVAVQTVEDLPEGALVTTAEKGEGAAQADEKKDSAGGPQPPPPPKKKKSFWRKLIPF